MMSHSKLMQGQYRKCELLDDISLLPYKSKMQYPEGESERLTRRRVSRLTSYYRCKDRSKKELSMDESDDLNVVVN